MGNKSLNFKILTDMDYDEFCEKTYFTAEDGGWYNYGVSESEDSEEKRASYLKYLTKKGYRLVEDSDFVDADVNKNLISESTFESLKSRIDGLLEYFEGFEIENFKDYDDPLNRVLLREMAMFGNILLHETILDFENGDRPIFREEIQEGYLLHDYLMDMYFDLETIVPAGKFDKMLKEYLLNLERRVNHDS